MRPLPPLTALRAFEAAARHGNFVKAAAELGVTAGAISQHIKALEERLGIALFRRLARGVKLTEAGRAYLPGIADGFDRLPRAIRTSTSSSARSGRQWTSIARMPTSRSATASATSRTWKRRI